MGPTNNKKLQHKSTPAFQGTEGQALEVENEQGNPTVHFHYGPSGRR